MWSCSGTLKSIKAKQWLERACSHFYVIPVNESLLISGVFHFYLLLGCHHCTDFILFCNSLGNRVQRRKFLFSLLTFLLHLKHEATLVAMVCVWVCVSTIQWVSWLAFTIFVFAYAQQINYHLPVQCINFVKVTWRCHFRHHHHRRREYISH